MFSNKNGEELIRLYLKSAVLLPACVFENIIGVSVVDFGINRSYCVSLPGYTWQCGFKYTGRNLQNLQHKDVTSLPEHIY